MAVDTRNKRFSMMYLGRPAQVTFLPDGTIDDGDRFALLGLYHGIALDLPPEEPDAQRHGGMIVNPTRGMDP